VDVIYNPLPNHLHAEWSIRALHAGKHVLCEKPLALSVAEVDAMAEAARESGRVLAEAFMYRHHPQTFKVQAIVGAGTLGTIRLIKGTFTFELQREGDIRLKKETGGGSIWDVGCYPISYARMIAGSEPVEVFGMQRLGAGGADLTFLGQLRFPNNIYAQFDSSFELPARSHIEIVGSQAVLEVPMPFKPRAKEALLLKRGDTTERIEVKGGELYAGEVEDMADAVLLGKEPRVSLADSRGAIAAIQALIRSAETGAPVMSN
jgi:predicted dehydrogenase